MRRARPWRRPRIEKDQRQMGNKVASLEKLGLLIGERLKAKNITAVVFDRNEDTATTAR